MLTRTPRRQETFNYSAPTTRPIGGPPAESILWEGWIRKQSGLPYRMWQPRWWILTKDHLTYYHDDMSESKKFDINDVRLFTNDGNPFTSIHDQSKHSCFFLEAKDARRMHLECATMETTEQFMRKVIQAREGLLPAAPEPAPAPVQVEHTLVVPMEAEEKPVQHQPQDDVLDDHQPKLAAEIEPVTLGSYIQLCHTISSAVAIVCKDPSTRSTEEAKYVQELEKLANQFESIMSNDPSLTPVFGLDSLPLLVVLTNRNNVPPQSSQIALTKVLQSLGSALGIRLQGIDENNRNQIREYMDAYAHLIELLSVVGGATGNPDLPNSFITSTSSLASSKPSRSTAQSFTAQTPSLHLT